MNDRYHAFGRQGFGAVYGSKQLKAIVVGGSGEVPVHDERAFRALCKQITDDYRRDVGWFMRLFAWVAKPKKWLSWMYRLMPRRRMKITAPVRAMRQLWSQRGTTAAVSLSVENGDAPVKNWKGVGSRDFPLRTHSSKLDGKEAVYSKNYLPIGMRDAVLAGDVLSGGSLNKSLGKAGHRIYSARRSVEAVAAAADVAKLLAVPVASPLLLVTSVSWGQNGQPIDYYNSWVRTDVVNVTVEASTGPK